MFLDNYIRVKNNIFAVFKQNAPYVKQRIECF